MKMGRIFIIAEAGINHNGDLETAKKLALEAKKAGADAVKYQTFKTSQLVSKFTVKAEYQKMGNDDQESQYDMIRRLELSYQEFSELQKYCTDIGIMFLSTPFDNESVDFLDSIGMPIYKIPSGEVTNLPYLIKIAQKNKPVLMSTGMCNEGEIRNACRVLNENGCNDITLLHCSSQYPLVYEDVNLLAMIGMRERLKIDTGYSDHTMGIEVSIAAAALGAKVIEKHFTLSRSLQGPDHSASLEPEELGKLVRSIRNVEISLGSKDKKVTPEELKNRDVVRKSIVAAKPIKTGDLLTEANLTIKRPGTGISPEKWDEVIGKISSRDYQEDELIK